jgi:hopanoid biosynthesis associated protein HpnK
MAGGAAVARSLREALLTVRPRFLIVTADDFGLHEALNEAVQQATDGGVLSAASLMMAAPATADAVCRARHLPQLRVGLHLVLADGCAVLPATLLPDLLDAQGRFGTRMFSAAVRYFLLPRARRQLEAEIRAQFAAFARTGLSLDHVNAHKHFHLHPTLLEMILDIGRDFGLRMMRVPDEPLWFSLRAGGALSGASTLLLAPWIALMRQRLRSAGVACNDYLFGIGGTGAMDEAALLEILGRLPPGVSELYLHPALPVPGPISSASAGYRHAEELRALLSERVRCAASGPGIVRGGYADVFPVSTGRRDPRSSRLH